MDSGDVGLIVAAIVVGVVVLLFLFSIWWKIFKKAGYSGALGLLMFVPVINFIMLLILAFSKWPIQRQLEQLQQQLGIHSK
jgi:heme/copper-type cytochrome/quinol oxidase subunit 2